MKKEYLTVDTNTTFKDLNVLIASLVFIVFQGDSQKKNILQSAFDYLKQHKMVIINHGDFLRLKKSMFIKLGVTNEALLGGKLILAIDNMLEKILKMFKEPFLYTLSAEKVTNILRKHDQLFKNEKVLLKTPKNDVFEPESPGETVKWIEN